MNELLGVILELDMDEMKISAEQITGSVELKTWFEVEMQPSGDWLLEGKSCAIYRRMDGSVRDVTFSTTGCAMTIPMNYRAPGFFGRLFNRKHPNAGVER